METPSVCIRANGLNLKLTIGIDVLQAAFQMKFIRFVPQKKEKKNS